MNEKESWFATLVKFFRNSEYLLATFFDFLNSLINNAEYSIINLIATILPWTVPVIPAYFAYANVINVLEVPTGIAWTIGFNTEGLGLVCMVMLTQFILHNRQNRAKRDKMDIGYVIGVFAIYIVNVLVLNVGLHSDVVGESAKIRALYALALLSIPAQVLIALRGMRYEILQTKGTKRDKSGTVTDRTDSNTVDWRNFQHNLTCDEAKRLYGLGKSGLKEELGLPAKTAGRWIDSYLPAWFEQNCNG